MCVVSAAQMAYQSSSYPTCWFLKLSYPFCDFTSRFLLGFVCMFLDLSIRSTANICWSDNPVPTSLSSFVSHSPSLGALQSIQTGPLSVFCPVHLPFSLLQALGLRYSPQPSVSPPPLYLNPLKFSAACKIYLTIPLRFQESSRVLVLAQSDPSFLCTSFFTYISLLGRRAHAEDLQSPHFTTSTSL